MKRVLFFSVVSVFLLVSLGFAYGETDPQWEGGISFSPNHPKPGEMVTVSAKFIVKLGTARDVTITAGFGKRPGKNEAVRRTYNECLEGFEEDISFLWKAKIGVKYFWFMIDSPPDTKDIKLSNNVIKRAKVIKLPISKNLVEKVVESKSKITSPTGLVVVSSKPDLVATTLDIYNSSGGAKIFAYDQFKVKCCWKIKGKAKKDWVVLIGLGNTIIEKKTITNSQGKTCFVKSHTFKSKGSSSARCRIDNDQDIDELDEENNYLFKTFKVEPAKRPIRFIQ